MGFAYHAARGGRPTGRPFCSPTGERADGERAATTKLVCSAQGSYPAFCLARTACDRRGVHPTRRVQPITEVKGSRSQVIYDPDAETPKIPLLDNPSDPTPFFSGLLDALVGRIEALEAPLRTGRLGEYVADGSLGAGPQTLPPPVSSRLADRLGDDYTFCRTHRDRFAVILEAQGSVRALERSAGNAAPVSVRHSDAWRRKIAEDTRSYKVLAKTYRLSERDITKIKREYREAPAPDPYRPPVRETELPTPAITLQSCPAVRPDERQ